MSGVLRQASCVAIGSRAVLIEGPPGIGKSSLALALIDRGARLVGDDGVSLEERDGVLWAEPPPNTAGLIEIRNVGLVEMAAVSAPVSLMIQLGTDAPRYLEDAATQAIEGCEIPVITLFSDTAALPLRAEWALTRHGLAF